MVKGPNGREKGVRFEQSRNSGAEEGGIIKISGKFLLDHEEEVLNLVKKQSTDNKLITDISKNSDTILVKTSDHNLAIRIGKALHSAYKGEHDFKFREGEKFAEVTWKRD
jgi:hypothetical protein